jgi:hypothetical protein
MPRRLLLLLTSIVGAACYSSTSPRERDGIACTLQAVPAVSVMVLDSASGLGLTFRNLWARARDGTFMDSSMVFQTLANDAPKTFSLAYERDGTYEVTVQAAGYREWKRSNVLVSRNECHVNPVTFTARLQR